VKLLAHICGHLVGLAVGVFGGVALWRSWVGDWVGYALVVTGALLALGVHRLVESVEIAGLLTLDTDEDDTDE